MEGYGPGGTGDDVSMLLPAVHSEGDIFINRQEGPRQHHRDMFAHTQSSQINGLFESQSEVFWKPKRYALNARPRPVPLLSKAGVQTRKAGAAGARGGGGGPRGGQRSHTSMGFSHHDGEAHAGVFPPLHARSKSTEPTAAEQEEHGKDGGGGKEGGGGGDKPRKYGAGGGLPHIGSAKPVEARPMGKHERDLQRKLDVFRSDPRRWAELQERVAKSSADTLQRDRRLAHVVHNRRAAWEGGPARRQEQIERAAEERDRRAEAARGRFESKQRELEEWRVYQANRDAVRKEQEDAKRQAKRAAELRRMRSLAWLRLVALGSRLSAVRAQVLEARRDREELAEQTAAATTIQRHFKLKKKVDDGQALEDAAVKIQRHFRSKVMSRLTERRVAVAQTLLRFLQDLGGADRTVIAFRSFRLKVCKAQRMVKMYITTVRAQTAMLSKQWERAEGQLLARRDGKRGGGITRGKSVKVTGGKGGADGGGAGRAPKGAERGNGGPDFVAMDVVLLPNDPLRRVPPDIKACVGDAFQRLKRRAFNVAMNRYRRQTVEWEEHRKKQAALEAARNIVQGLATDDGSRRDGGPVRPTFRTLASPEQVRVVMQEGVRETYRVRTSNREFAQGPIVLEPRLKVELTRAVESSLRKNAVVKEMLEAIKQGGGQGKVLASQKSTASRGGR